MLDRIVKVEWTDSETFCGWQVKEDVGRWAEAPPTTCKSVGWLLSETDSHLVLIPNINHDNYAECTKIPRVCVLKMTDLYGTSAVPA